MNTVEPTIEQLELLDAVWQGKFPDMTLSISEESVFPYQSPAALLCTSLRKHHFVNTFVDTVSQGSYSDNLQRKRLPSCNGPVAIKF